MVNKKDIPKMEAELSAAKGTDCYEKLRDKYEGPGVGLDYDEESGKLHIAEGWTADPDGNIVPVDSVTGPGV